MRIVGGTWAGRPLTSPAGRVRPTAEELREAVMDALGADLAGARVLDLFAGSGALGLEALSRGAASCDFVENDRAALHALKANVASVRAAPRTRVFTRDAIPFADQLGEGAYDLAFADPPYGSAKLDRILQRWEAAPFAPILALEHAVDRPARGGTRTRQVGDAVFTVLRV